MAYFFPNLDHDTRQLMIEEIQHDISNSRLFVSNRLSVSGKSDYVDLLFEAARNFDEEWLADQLRLNQRLNTHEDRNLHGGKVIKAEIPATAAETLAGGEFNRFYIRAICRRASGDLVELYRAKQATNPRPESESVIGNQINADGLLNDMRTHAGEGTYEGAVFGIPSGPNSGISVKLI